MFITLWEKRQTMALSCDLTQHDNTITPKPKKFIVQVNNINPSIRRTGKYYSPHFLGTSVHLSEKPLLGVEGSFVDCFVILEIVLHSFCICGLGK